MKNRGIVYLTVIALLIGAVAADAPAPAVTEYVNHTVGGADGWFFNATTNGTSANYSSWAAAQTFNLGDYLIFNTNSNQTVIQTYNETSYQSCTIDDYTVDFYGGSDLFGQPATVYIPLTIKGPNYYFSDADDGEQCLNGLAFEITVNQGLGLPPSLNQPPPPPYVDPPSPSVDQSTPVAVISTNNGARVGANVRWGVSGLMVFIGGLVVM